jgi:serine/threonine protein kinase
MAAPATIEAFLDLVRKSGVVEQDALEGYIQGLRESGKLPPVPAQLAGTLVRDGILTQFQARQFLLGKWRGLIINGKYHVLEHLGSGGMGSVFLCEHKAMRRRVALKLLPPSQARDPSSVERFFREARAVAALDHPNLVRAHDIDRDDKHFFLVMEYVDGNSLQAIVAKNGPLDVMRAANYIRQVALGLHQAHQAGLVHRDIKPGNLLLDRNGVVKILDMGLALFFHDKSDKITQQYDERSVLGTADYLAPEQAMSSHDVDIRADLYSLGATFYFLLTGAPPFGEGTVSQKLIWHQMRSPKSVREIRPEIPEGLEAILAKLLAKDPAQRYQSPAEVYEALAPWTQTPIGQPPESEMPRLSLRARGNAGDSSVMQPLSGSTVDSAFPTLPGRPRELPAPSTPQPHSPEPATAIRREENTAITAAAPAETAKEGPPTAVAPRPLRRFGWLVAALVLITLGTVTAVAAVAIAMFSMHAQPVADKRPPAQTAPETHPVAGEPVKQPPATEPAVAVRFENNAYHVRTPTYEALVDSDGCLNSVRVGGVEFLHPGGVPLAGGKSFSRGSYFHSDRDGAVGLMKMTNLKQPAPNVIAATGDKLSITYEFAADSLTCKLTNATDYTVPFYVIFDPKSVTDVFNEDGERALVPVALRQDDPQQRKWATTTWIAGNSWLKLSGGNTLWGPWDQARLQVWQATLTTYESRTLKWDMGEFADKKPANVPARPVLDAAGVVVKRDYNGRHVFAEHYDASVGDDGFMPSLRVNGVEFFKAGVDVSRGLYLLQLPGGWPAFSKVDQPSEKVIEAEGEKAAIRHTFTPGGVTWTVENRSDTAMAFFIVFDPGVRLVRDGQGEWSKLPAITKPGDAAAKWQKTSWFAGKSRLTLTGGNRVWGPWNQKYQVWEATLTPHETRTATAEVGAITEEEAARFTQLTGAKPGEEPNLPLTSPLDFQVFQRASRLAGSFLLRGHVRPACERAEVRVTGQSLQGGLSGQWQALQLQMPARSFDQALPLAAGGWYKVEVRALKGDQVVAQAAVAHVGVGEVFVGAGQSNSTNCGQERIQQTSGMVSSFSGSDWRLADDPQPGVHDNTEGGSYWPAFGDAMYEKYHVPIGVASVGHSGTSVNQWQPDGELFRWMMTRIGQLGPHGFRGLQWHQGESDVGMTSDEYAELLTKVIEQSKKAAGWDFPWFVAQVSYHNPNSPSFVTTRDAQKKLWEKGVALEGPDTDTLTGDNRDMGGLGIHFSPKGLRAHGKMWADKVGIYLDKLLKD